MARGHGERPAGGGSARLALLGDLNTGGGIDALLGQRPPEWFWADTLDVLRLADGAIANLEVPLTASRAKWQGRKLLKFRASPDTAAILTAANLRLVNLANNHVLDRRERGLLDTRSHLDEAGIAHAGAGPDLATARRAAHATIGGLRVALIGLTDNMAVWAADAAGAGHHFVTTDTAAVNRAYIAGLIAEARAAGAEFVIVSAHVGINYVGRAHRRRYRAFARMVIEAGADLYHGHSAHMVDAVEPWKGGIILYDCGDILHDYIPVPLRPSEWAMVFLLDVKAGAARRLRMVPCQIGANRVRRAAPALSRRIMRRMRRLSRPLGVELDGADGELILDLSSG
jgi:poly-gamma-glutamate synthesis protein (capsule biosynthesis protein)